eukprot:COSAG06_NODE_15580_length_1060_cov_1.523413_1_plen_28_part_10
MAGRCYNLEDCAGARQGRARQDGPGQVQ